MGNRYDHTISHYFRIHETQRRYFLQTFFFFISSLAAFRQVRQTLHFTHCTHYTLTVPNYTDNMSYQQEHRPVAWDRNLLRSRQWATVPCARSCACSHRVSIVTDHGRSTLHVRVLLYSVDNFRFLSLHMVSAPVGV